MLVVLLLILLGIIDFGRLLFVTQGVKSASREGARTAVVGGNYTQATIDALASASALSATGVQACRFLESTTGTYPEFGDWTAVLGGTTACGPVVCSAANVQSVKIYAMVQFQWLTPIGFLPGVNDPTLQGSRNVYSSTTMRCE